MQGRRSDIFLFSGHASDCPSSRSPRHAHHELEGADAAGGRVDVRVDGEAKVAQLRHAVSSDDNVLCGRRE